jgi:hypothetical protein
MGAFWGSLPSFFRVVSHYWLNYVRSEITAVDISTPWTIALCGKKMEALH